MNIAKLRQWTARTVYGWNGAFPRCARPGCEARNHWFWPGHGIRLQQRWYCSPQCFESAARQCFARVLSTVSLEPHVQHRIPLGLVLLSRGYISNAQLRRALQAQRERGGRRIGEWLEEMGFATESQVTAAMGLQWACPVLPDAAVAAADLAAILPLRLLEDFRMLPVYFSRERLLYMAFSEGVDYTVLYAIEQALDCRTEACLAGRTAVKAVFEQLRHQRRPTDFLFEGRRDSTEMARITCGCAIKLGASHVRILVCGEFVWVRLTGELDPANILFQRDILNAPFLSGK